MRLEIKKAGNHTHINLEVERVAITMEKKDDDVVAVWVDGVKFVRAV